jgi:hypothetical protein
VRYGTQPNIRTAQIRSGSYQCARHRPASAVSNAVTPMGPDIAPRVRVSGLPRKLKLKRFLKGIKFSVTPSKAASLQISLLATASGATISRAFNLTLVSRSLRRSARRRTLKLVPSKTLVGHRTSKARARDRRDRRRRKPPDNRHADHRQQLSVAGLIAPNP